MAIPPLHSNFRAFLKLLNSHGVKYLLIGGCAVNVHGYYRNTGDLDVWVSVSPENLKRLAAAANEFGWPTKSDSYLNFGEMMQMGVRPYRIEVLTDISAVEFDPCYRNRVHVKIDPELTISVINIEDLRKTKPPRVA